MVPDDDVDVVVVAEGPHPVRPEQLDARPTGTDNTNTVTIIIMSRQTGRQAVG